MPGGNGLGVTVDRDYLDQCTTRCDVVS
jgi:hypothetical protein